MAGSHAVLGLDLGTTIVKAVVLEGDGTVSAAASSRRLNTVSPRPDRAEQDPVRVWAAAAEAIRGVVEALDGSATLSGISVAAQSGSLLWLGAGGEPLGPLVTWMDARTAGRVRRWTEDGTAERIRAVTGWTAATGLGLPLIAWLRERSKLSAVERLGGADSLILDRLIGRWVTNPSNAAGLQLMDLEQTRWSDELCDLVGIDAGALPLIEASGTRVGVVTESAATDTGLRPGLPVFNGGHDQACTALGLGLTDPGDVLLAGGTAWVLTTVAGSPGMAGLSREINVSHHVTTGGWTRSQLLGGFGAHIEELLAGSHGEGQQELRRRLLRRLDREIGSAVPELDAPYFVPRSFRDGTGREVSNPGRGEKARAIMEYAGFRLGAALARNGAAPAAVTLVGGVNHSPHWPQCLADITGAAMVVSRSPSWPATGAAVLAGAGAGLFETLEAGMTRLKQDQTRVEPDSDGAERYRARAAALREMTKEADE